MGIGRVKIWGVPVFSEKVLGQGWMEENVKTRAVYVSLIHRLDDSTHPCYSKISIPIEYRKRCR
jgi:hypothetical protein